jgi:hypothetical protein
MMYSAYERAQRGLALLKGSIYELIKQAGPDGLRNVEVGKALGIYAGHIGHEGHISRTLLEVMRSEGVVNQTGDKKWVLADLGGQDTEG